MTKNYYEILKISVDASMAEIKSAFRKLARKWHPDVAGNSAEVVNKFKEINEAYEVLSNEKKRNKYDALRGILHKAQKTTKENSLHPENKANNSSSKSTSEKKQEENKSQKNEQKNVNDVNSDNKNTLHDAWDNFIKKTKQSPPPKQSKFKPKKNDGSDIVSDITITISEALLGTTRSVNILHTEPCPKCKGHKFANGATCSYCNGAGEISVHKKISVKIPENVKQNAKIRIAGEGNLGYNGGKNGDLYLIVKIDEEQQTFKYDGLNIIQTVPVEPYEAVLGATIQIKTVSGNISMKLSSGTVNGQKYRIAKQGLTKDGKTGDIIVIVQIEVPKNLSKEEVLLYKKLQEAAGKRNIREIMYGK